MYSDYLITLLLMYSIYATKSFPVVRVYNGPGTEIVDNVVIPSIRDGLVRRGYTRPIVTAICAKKLSDLSWLNTTNIFVLPGGRDLPYVRDLNEEILKNIRKFIQKGGSYLALCAGAYFSSRFVIFEEGTPLEVIGPRSLNLFHGITKGSVYPGFKYKSTKGACTAPIDISSSFHEYNNNNSFAYFNGGCEFIPDKDYKEFEVLATYKDFPGKLAMVSLKLGSGHVVLSGVHPEIDMKYLSESSYSQKQWNDMVDHVSLQRDLLDSVLKHLIKI